MAFLSLTSSQQGAVTPPESPGGVQGGGGHLNQGTESLAPVEAQQTLKFWSVYPDEKTLATCGVVILIISSTV